jgi:putative sterol carrier protein
MKQSVDVWREINSGKRNPKMAFMSGKLKVSGSLTTAMKLGKMFFPL